MKQIELSNCATLDDVRRVVSSSLKGKELVRGFKDAVTWFHHAGIAGDVACREVFRKVFTLYDSQRHGAAEYCVYLYEYYADSSSNDYCYSYNIVEL